MIKRIGAGTGLPCAALAAVPARSCPEAQARLEVLRLHGTAGKGSGTGSGGERGSARAMQPQGTGRGCTSETASATPSLTGGAALYLPSSGHSPHI